MNIFHTPHPLQALGAALLLALAACGGDGDGIEQTLASSLTATDPSAGCEWLRGVQTMSAEMGIDYTWSGRDAGASQTQRTKAHVQGVLRRTPVDVIGMVQFQGVMSTGRVQLDIETTEGSDRTTVKADGTPLAPAGIDTLVGVWVKLSDCTVFTYANVYVPAVHTKFTPQGSFLLDGSTASFGFHHDYRPIAGRREFIGDERMPARGAASLPEAFVLDNGHHDFDQPTRGTAQVRWAFRPQ